MPPLGRARRLVAADPGAAVRQGGHGLEVQLGQDPVGVRRLQRRRDDGAIQRGGRPGLVARGDQRLRDAPPCFLGGASRASEQPFQQGAAG